MVIFCYTKKFNIKILKILNSPKRYMKPKNRNGSLTRLSQRPPRCLWPFRPHFSPQTNTPFLTKCTATVWRTQHLQLSRQKILFYTSWAGWQRAIDHTFDELWQGKTTWARWFPKGEQNPTGRTVIPHTQRAQEAPPSPRPWLSAAGVYTRVALVVTSRRYVAVSACYFSGCSVQYTTTVSIVVHLTRVFFFF